MVEIKNVLICGLGAIGSVYAVKISQDQSISLRILTDEQRIKRYENLTI